MGKMTIEESIQNSHVEVHYNEKTIRVNSKQYHIQLQGKITCPILNQKVSSLTCSKIMEQKDWPRNVDCNICDRANCKIYKSINKNKKKYDKNTKPKKVN